MPTQPLIEGWAGPAWGEPSAAISGPPPLRTLATSATAGYRAEGGTSGSFLVLGASVAGVSHRLGRRRCEDSFAWAQPGPGKLALVTADGVGSAGRGGEGAELAVTAACEYLVQAPGAREQAVYGAGGPELASQPPGVPAPGAADSWRQPARSPLEAWGSVQCARAIAAADNALACSGGEAAGELATTIVVALVCLEDLNADPSGADPSGDGTSSQLRARVVAGRVGDSSAFILSDEGGWQELFPVAAGTSETGTSEKGDRDDHLVGGATRALPSSVSSSSCRASAKDGPGEEGPQVELASAELVAGACVVLVTDGVAGPLRDGPTTVAPRLAEVLALAPTRKLGPLGLAQVLDFSRRGAHDDRTLLAAWLVPTGR